MRKLVLIAACIAAVGFSVSAQDAPQAQPVATLSIGDGGLITYVAGGDYLVAADGAQLELYNLTDPANPRDAASIVLDDLPVALAATSDFALVALPTESSPDEVQVIAPDRYSRGGFGIVNFLDVPDQPRGIALSPNNRWAFVYGQTGYVHLSLAAADNIEASAPVETGDSPVIDAALTNDHALLIHEGGTVSIANLSTNSTSQITDASLQIDGAATAVSISSDAAIGAVALADNRVVLFDAATFEVLNTIPLEDGPVTDMSFITQDGRRTLVLMIENRPAVMLLDVTDPANVGLPGSVGVGNDTVRAIATQGDFLALSGSDRVLIFQLIP